MLLDGIVATQTGRYIGTAPGPGPWATIVQAAGIDPLSYTMHGIFIVYGIAWLAAIGYALTGRSVALYGMAILTLWYVPFGTLLSLLVLGVSLWTSGEKRRARNRRDR